LKTSCAPLFEGTLDRMLYPGISSSLKQPSVALISEKIASQPPPPAARPTLLIPDLPG
jgi:hypothetical protein